MFCVLSNADVVWLAEKTKMPKIAFERYQPDFTRRYLVDTEAIVRYDPQNPEAHIIFSCFVCIVPSSVKSAEEFRQWRGSPQSGFPPKLAQMHSRSECQIPVIFYQNKGASSLAAALEQTIVLLTAEDILVDTILYFRDRHGKRVPPVSKEKSVSQPKKKVVLTEEKEKPLIDLTKKEEKQVIDINLMDVVKEPKQNAVIDLSEVKESQQKGTIINLLDEGEEEAPPVSVRPIDVNDTVCYDVFGNDKSSVSQADLDSLNPRQWLTGSIINAYGMILNRRILEKKKNAFVFNSQLNFSANNTNLIDMIQDKKFEKMYFPRNLGQQHWILIVVTLDPDKIYYIDSLGHPSTVSPMSQLNELKMLLERILSPKKFEVEIYNELEKQKNGYDCGVFVLATIESNLPFIVRVSQEKMPDYRNRVREQIIDAAVQCGKIYPGKK